MISVIIPTCHRNDLLAKCLDCLAPGAQTLSPEQYEVIVTDDGSCSTAGAMLAERYPWVQWVAGPRKGPAANRNSGAALAQGEWLAFTDDDCLPGKDWLVKLAEAMDGPALAMEGAVHPIGDLSQDLSECPVNLTGGYFWSANIAVKRSLFEQIDGFDPTYPLAAHEDVDIKLRLKALTEIMFVPDAAVMHPVRVLSLKSIISSLPKRNAAWAHHVNKHSRELGYTSTVGYAVSQYKFHGRMFSSNIRQKKYGSLFQSILMLLVGIPITLPQIKLGR